MSYDNDRYSEETYRRLRHEVDEAEEHVQQAIECLGPIMVERNVHTTFSREYIDQMHEAFGLLRRVRTLLGGVL